MLKKSEYLSPEIDIIRLQMDGDDVIDTSSPYNDDPEHQFPVVTYPGQG